MGKKDIKTALMNSISGEEKSVQDRFEKAETLLGKNSEKSPSFGKLTQPKEKLKVIRDSFTMPQTDYDLIATLKTRSLNSGVQATKSEILRAGLLALKLMTDADFLDKIGNVEKIKTGRPKQTI